MSCPLVALLDKLASVTGFDKKDLRIITNLLNHRNTDNRVFLDFYSELSYF